MLKMRGKEVIVDEEGYEFNMPERSKSKSSRNPNVNVKTGAKRSLIIEPNFRSFDAESELFVR